MVAILDRMLELAVSLNWRADREDLFADELAILTGPGRPSTR